MSSTECKKQIRRHVRNLRRQLSPQQQQLAAEQIAEHILLKVSQHKEKYDFGNNSLNSMRVALFLSMDGEINTHLAIERLWQANIEVYIPLIHPFNANYLLFIRYLADQPLLRSPLGMLEPQPDCSKVCPLAQLDILFTPLVAFDPNGNRLGMGGGFYDRTLAPHYQQQRTRPAIIGLAHDCQEISNIPIEPWDLPLSQIITPSNIYSFYP